MISEKMQKSRLGKAILGGFLSFAMMLTGVTALLGGGQNVYADELTEPATETVETTEKASETENEGGENKITGELENEINGSEGAKSCKESLGAVGWLVCPATGTISKAVDWLYDKIEELLVINPVEMKDGQPIYEIWKYFRGVTNVIFVIFLLVVIYSQITGVGITNYGIKKVLPKMIVVAILINLSFIICSLAVDLSNIVGNSLRGVFENIEMSVMGENFTPGMTVTMSQMYAALGAGGTVAVAAGVVAFEAGAVWMLIPTVLGAIVAVATGLITIALRQAVVAILIMIAPLAIVAYMLPNTEKWFTQWRQLLVRMLVFYPAFSLLFGASNLAGFAIIASAKSGFGIVLGAVVQVFPLFFAWKLMRMSGTFLETVNTKLRGLAEKPLAANRAWAESHRAATLNKHLAAKDVYTPSLALRQYLENRRIARELDTKGDADLAGKRGAAYAASLNYKYDWRTGKLIGASRKGEEASEKIGRGFKYDRIVLRDKNNLSKGLSQIEAMSAKGSVQRARLEAIDAEIVRNSDDLKFEQARTEKIDYDNAYGFHKRAEDAINAHEDFKYEGLTDKDGNVIYKMHNIKDRAAAAARYGAMESIMDGSELDAHFAGAYAAAAYDTQSKIIMTKFQKYAELNPPTKDDIYRLKDFSLSAKPTENIDAIVAMLRVINQRGDTDLVKDIWMDIKKSGIELGTHASQAMAGLLMFDVGDNDPMLKREGKYINLETAQVFNENKRKDVKLDPFEYLRGYYLKRDENGNQLEDIPENRVYTRKAADVLLTGTSFDNIERTAMANLTDSLMEAYGFDKDNPDKPWDVKGFLKRNNELRTAIGPQFIGASLKYLSGSEQINSAVEFLTGYSNKAQKETYIDEEDGKEKQRPRVDSELRPIYGLTPIWNNGSFAGHEKDIKDFYNKQTLQWIKDQTVNQVLNMRSDYRDPVGEHLLDYFLNNDDGAVFTEEDEASLITTEERRKFYDDAIAEIQTRYGDKPADEAKRLRDADIKDLRQELMGREIRHVLGATGALDRIERMSRSSASSTTKGWMNKWLSYGDEKRLSREVAFYKLERKKEYDAKNRARSDSRVEDPAAVARREELAQECRDEMGRYWEKAKDAEVREFYEGLIGVLHGKLGDDSFVERDFEMTYGEEVDEMTNLELYDIIMNRYLNDPDLLA